MCLFIELRNKSKWKYSFFRLPSNLFKTKAIRAQHEKAHLRWRKGHVNVA